MIAEMLGVYSLLWDTIYIYIYIYIYDKRTYKIKCKNIKQYKYIKIKAYSKYY